ncbi:MAG: hypothetical protein RIE24_16920 [Silicimonas sp.]
MYIIQSNLKERVADWLADESGNVTVEWVAVVAGVVAFAIIALSSISGGVADLAAGTGTELETRPLVIF